MLINFRFKNFKNFKNETNLSFQMQGEDELEEHIIEFKDEYKLVPLKVIYGSNASGKTNVLKAVNALKSILLKTELSEIGSQNYMLTCSNFDSMENFEAPMEFDITFSIDEDIYRYLLVIQNSYLEQKTRVIKEKLEENGFVIFERNKNNISFSEDKRVIKKHFTQFENQDFKSKYMKMMKTNMSSDRVFTNWYSMIDADLCKKMDEYFRYYLLVICDLEDFKLRLPNSREEGIFSNDVINTLLEELETDNKEFYVEVDKDGIVKERVSYKINRDFSVDTFPEITESKGTIKLIDIIEPILSSLSYGCTILIDEFDASIHHEIIYNIIQAFGDKRINKKGAQLIFTTHNPVYMNKDLLRKDEIVFVEKEDTAIMSTLADSNLKNNEIYMNNYLAGRYTILPNFDIRNILEVGDKKDK